MKKYSIEINEYKYYDEDVKELIENKVSEYASLDEALTAWREFYYEYASISFHGDATDGDYYYSGEGFLGVGFFAYENENITYEVYIHMKDELGELVNIDGDSDNNIKLNNENLWVARPSGDMTIEIFDDTIKEQVVKIDMLQADKINIEKNEDVLSRSLNNLSIMTLFPQIFTSLFERDAIISKMPMNQGWSYAYAWVRTFRFKTMQLLETSVNLERFFEVIPYPKFGFSEFPWTLNYNTEKRYIRICDAENRLIAEEIFPQTFPNDRICYIRLMFEIGTSYLNQFLSKGEEGGKYVALLYYSNAIGACGGFLYYHASTEDELKSEILKFITPDFENLLDNEFITSEKYHIILDNLETLDFNDDDIILKTHIWGRGIDGIKSIINYLKDLAIRDNKEMNEGGETEFDWLIGNSEEDYDQFIEGKDEELRICEGNENYDMYSIYVPYIL